MNTKSATPAQAEAQDAVLWPEVIWPTFDWRGARYWFAAECPTQAELAPAAYRRADLVSWRPMSSAPVGDVTACIDIWSGEEDRRYTDCFWGVPGDLPGNAPCWSHEETILANDAWVYVTERVPDPVAWMPAPVKPEGL